MDTTRTRSPGTIFARVQSPGLSAAWQRIGPAAAVCPPFVVDPGQSLPSVATPHDEERINSPIDKDEFNTLLDEAKTLLNVHNDQYDNSIRHTIVKEALSKSLPNRGVQSLPLGVQRRQDNPEYVTWTGSDTILGNATKNPRFTLITETRVTRLIPHKDRPNEVAAAVVRSLNTNRDELVIAKVCLLRLLAVS